MNNRTKTCTHCGRETHPQPQDHNHDTEYGHCYDCLSKANWYIKSAESLAPGVDLTFWDSRDYNGGPISTDDSHGKVIEVKVAGKLAYHQTLHMTKDKIRELLKTKFIN